ncbi:MAG: NAD(P)-dependent glycerol-3-phosphate dehydrogenase [Gammaproteobacteria bacterium]|jgi:glycerol-3-phosphate dehydrogenase (NAD(P)+)
MPGSAIAVLGAGSWGTSLAVHLARNGHAVHLWDRKPEAVEAMSRTRTNARYLPNIEFPPTLTPTADLEAVCAACDDLLIAVPSKAFRGFLKTLQPHLRPTARLIWATKGLEVESGKFLHQVLEEELGVSRPYAVISGPSFAWEVACGLPTAITVAGGNAAFCREVATILHSETFRAYTSDDLIGVQLGGALKNVMAIAAGISDGLGFGANARAALVTRGLAEMVRLGDRLGARAETLMGLSGLGDLVLTCTDDQSRNRRLGLALGQGKALESALRDIGQAVEGAVTAKVVMRLAGGTEVELPISQQVFRVLYEGIAPRAAVSELLGRDLKPELG